MGTKHYTGPLERLDGCRWRIPRSYKPQMRVDGLIYANDALIDAIKSDQSPEQVANVACLPGIVGASLAMPDIHWGYGFSIGGVAATDPQQGGIVSPGGVGYDINCGVRLIRSDILFDEVKGRIPQLVDGLFDTVPCGVGAGGGVVYSRKNLGKLLAEGAGFVVRDGYGWDEDLEHTEAGGALDGARPDYVSERAQERGANQCGTLGAGNHFLEIQRVEEIFDPVAAAAFGLAVGQLAIMIHSGSRGLGYQVCDDALKDLRNVPAQYGIDLPDRQLVCAPVESPEGQRYLGAMRAAANYAWANRQIMTHLARTALARVLGKSAEQLGLRLVYDVAHNIAKMETHVVGGQPDAAGGQPSAAGVQPRTLCVHRKGATRAFPAGHPEVPAAYRAIGQPVLVPGDMGRYSYVLVGLPSAMTETFGSACHGAGRRMSRTAAAAGADSRVVARDLADRGVYVRARSREGLTEEQPSAYKDVADVVDALEAAGISRKVARMRPVGVVKG